MKEFSFHFTEEGTGIYRDLAKAVMAAGRTYAKGGTYAAVEAVRKSFVGGLYFSTAAVSGASPSSVSIYLSPLMFFFTFGEDGGVEKIVAYDTDEEDVVCEEGDDIVESYTPMPIDILHPNFEVQEDEEEEEG